MELEECFSFISEHTCTYNHRLIKLVSDADGCASLKFLSDWWVMPGSENERLSITMIPISPIICNICLYIQG